MKSKFSFIQKMCSWMLVLALIVSMIPTTVQAAPKERLTGSLTINKLDKDSKEPIEGVEFTAYRIIDLTEENNTETYRFTESFAPFFEGTLTADEFAASDAEQLTRYISDLESYIKSEGISGTAADTTNAEGLAEISDLNLGYYLIVETAYPAQVIAPMASFILSVPMMNQTGNGWIYDIKVSPKNITATTGVSLTKTGSIGNGAEQPLQGVTFKLEKKNGDDWKTVGDLPTNEDGIIQVDDLTQGTYRFTEVSAPEGYIVNSTPIEFTVKWNGEKLVYDYNGDTFENLNIKVNNDKPTIDKVVSQPEANIGHSVTWTVTATVPELIQSLKTYEIIDTLSQGLTYQPETLVVKLGETTLQLGTDYTVHFDETANQVSIQFKPERLSQGTLTITYETVLNEHAILAGDGNPNKVQLNYSTSTDENSTPTTTTPEKDPAVYTFGLKIIKENTQNELLSGAIFDLYRVTDSGNVLVKEGLETVNGIVTVDGLASGKYMLVETQAPEGYNLLKNPIYFEITSKYENGVLVEHNTTNGYYEMTVINKKGFTLPETGGMGTIIFTVVGLGMMTVAASAYVIMKRKDTQK